jgi:surfactin synthase thioesterase subunit
MVPHAGGSPSALRPFAGRLDPAIEVVAVHLPGREKRYPEAPGGSIAEMARAVVAALGELPDLPYALFGHSMGGLLAYEIARSRIAAGGPAPVHLVVSAVASPREAAGTERRHTWADQRLCDWMVDLGGVAPTVAADEQLLALLLPIMRADLRACETYRYRPGPLLRCPLTVFGGRADRLVTVPELSGWAAYAVGGADLRLFDGDHFYLLDEESGAAGCLSDTVSGGDAR